MTDTNSTPKKRNYFTLIIEWSVAILVLLAFDHFTCNWISGGEKEEVQTSTIDTVKVADSSAVLIDTTTNDTIKK